MKKKILSILVTILALCICMFTLTACGGNEPPHTHTYDQQVVSDTFKASDATCEDKAEYYYSCSCGEKGTETFENGSALGHTYGTWVSIGNGQHKKTCANDNSHTITETCSGGTATCTEKAVCDNCGNEYGSKETHNYTELKQSETQHWYECSCGAYETKENHNPGASATETTDQKCTECNYVITPALGHLHTLHLTKVDAKPQSCTEEGNIEYYICSCNKWFTDNTATTEIIDKDSVVIEKDDHSYTELKQSSTQHWYECTCGAYETKENHIPGAEATETTDQICAECKYVITPALGHVHASHLTKVDAKPQSCTKEGNIEYYICSCDKWFTDNSAITEITDKKSVVIEKDKHNYIELEHNETQHWNECVCGDKSGIEEHKGGTATCIEKAICSVCSIEYGQLKMHNPKQQWETDDTYHWHKCETNGCSYQCNKTTHVLNSNKKCTICDYVSSQYLFTIIWKNYDGTILEEDKNVLYGTVPTYDGETPIKEKDKQYTYVFSGWAPNIIGATENVTYTAQFNFSANTYKVQFLDYDGSVLEEQEVEYGKDALVPENPERDGYRFIGWDKGYEKITADLTVKALYIEQVSIDFIDYDGSTILTYNIDKGANVEIFPEDPTREYYRFTGWDVDVFENIDSDLTIKATYVRVYDIVFMDYDGTELESQEVVSGESGTFPSNEPKREGYTFIGWEGSVENVTEDRELVALYEINKYSVTFKDVDGTVLLVQENVTYLTSATPPKAQEVYYDYTTDKGYRFTGWDKSYKGITQDTVITAVYGEEIIEPIIFIEEINSVSRKEETVKVRVMIHCDFIIYGVSLNIGFADKLRLSTEVNGEYCKTGENLNYTEAIGHDNVYEFRWSDTNGINFADSKVTETGTITIITLTFTWDSSSINTSQKEIEIFSDSYIINDKLEKQVPVIISSVINIVA